MTSTPATAPSVPPRTIGWDLGGVHVKAALAEAGRIRAVVQAPCALWRGLAALDAALADLPDWARGEAWHRVTMTGELCDCFASRAEGVAALAGWAAERLDGPVAVYAGRSGFVEPDVAAARAADVASANWHASAALAAGAVRQGLLVDIGSTTADLIPFAEGRPIAAGYSDAERLATGELIYTGAVRTPLPALASAAPFKGVRTSLVAEPFATTADIYRLLGTLPDGADQQESADGRGKSTPETETRLARIVGRDRDEAAPEAWRRLAAFFAEAQLRQLQDAAALILSRAELSGDAPVIGCGVGAFIARRLADRLERPYREWASLVGSGGDPAWISACAPAVAVALID